MSQRRGYLNGLTAYVVWGFIPLYFRALLPSRPGEILAHRVVWSLVFMAALTTALRRWRHVVAFRQTPRKLAGIALAGGVVAINWFTYIFGVNSGHVVETSLGYFINPLISVLFGVLVFRERLRAVQWVALGIGVAAVAVIAIDYGRLPWIALVLAVSFATYGLIKKRVGVPPTDGLLLETTALVPLALAYVVWLAITGQSTFASVSIGHTVMLVAAGAVTAIPLLMFADAANRLPMTSLGVLQYAAPILQFVTGVYLLHEPMPGSLLIGFGLVWLALIVFTYDAIRHARSRAGIVPDQAVASAPAPAAATAEAAGAAGEAAVTGAATAEAAAANGAATVEAGAPDARPAGLGHVVLEQRRSVGRSQLDLGHVGD